MYSGGQRPHQPGDQLTFVARDHFTLLARDQTHLWLETASLWQLETNLTLVARDSFTLAARDQHHAGG